MFVIARVVNLAHGRLGITFIDVSLNRPITDSTLQGQDVRRSDGAGRISGALDGVERQYRLLVFRCLFSHMATVDLCFCFCVSLVIVCLAHVAPPRKKP